MTIILLSKAFVKEHQRHKKDGSVYTVLAHYNKRVKKNTEHAPEHGHDLSHLNDDDKARFNQMHAEQHLAKHYDEHAIKQQLQDSRAEHDKLIRDADVQDKLGDHKAATRLRNKAIKVNQHMMRFQRQLSKLEETIQGIGKMKEKLVAGSGELVHDAAAHAHYVSKLGAKFKGRIMFIKKVTKPKQPFIPTHTLSDGVPARHVEGNIYIDKDGDEVQDYYAEPVDKIDDSKGSDKVDPHSFITAPDGSKDFGEITSEQAEKIGNKSGKIRLQQGFHNDDDGSGYGKIHIDRELRKDQLKDNGYQSTEELVDDVAKNHNAIYQGKGGSYILAKLNGKAKIAYVLVKEGNDGIFYSIGSGLVTRDGYLKNKPLLWERAQTNQLKESPSAVTGKSNGPNKTIPQLPKNATEKDSPKEGERNAEGLVFHDGRWHREGDNADKSARFHADIKALKETNFKYKAGDKVIDKESGKKYMVLSSYIQDGQVRYTVYPPGKKSSVGHHIWIKESDLVNSGNDEAKKPAKVVSIKEVARKPEAEKLADEDNPNSPNYRFRDTGYIGGSRKEDAALMIRSAAKGGVLVRSTAIDWDEIEKNPREAHQLITKSNLFGKVDWDSLKVEGMEPSAGFLVDRVYASVAKEPEDNAPMRKDYAVGIETLRDRMEACKTPDEVVKVLAEIRGEYEGTMLSATESEEYQKANDEVNRLRGILRAANDEKDVFFSEMV